MNLNPSKPPFLPSHRSLSFQGGDGHGVDELLSGHRMPTPEAIKMTLTNATQAEALMGHSQKAIALNKKSDLKTWGKSLLINPLKAIFLSHFGIFLLSLGGLVGVPVSMVNVYQRWHEDSHTPSNLQSVLSPAERTQMINDEHEIMGRCKFRLSDSQQVLAVIGFAATAICGVGALSGGVRGIPQLKNFIQGNGRNIWQGFVASLKDSRDFNEKYLQLNPETEPAKQMVSRILSRQIEAAASDLAQKADKLYAEELEVRTFFNSTFGSKPSKNDFKKLFQYYAYHWLRSEKPNLKNEISALEFLKRIYVLMEVAKQSGDLFGFVEPASKKPFGEVFHPKALLTSMISEKLSTVQTKVDQRVQEMIDFSQKEAQAEHYLTMARGALTTASMASNKSPDQIEQLKQAIQKLSTHHEKIKQARKTNEDCLITDESLIAGFDETFEDLVIQLRVVSDVETVVSDTTLPSENLPDSLRLGGSGSAV